jgi:hypothetical protein
MKEVNKTQRAIIVLLILAILFSAGSIIISFSALSDFDIPTKKGVSGQVAGSGTSGLSFYVEGPPGVANG